MAYSRRRAAALRLILPSWLRWKGVLSEERGRDRKGDAHHQGRGKSKASGIVKKKLLVTMATA